MFSQKSFLTALPALLAAMLATGCTDSAYDLSDIDTTTELKVNNLAIPVNMEDVTLDQVIEIKEGDKLKVVDGKYAVMIENDFESDPIEINPISIKAPEIDPTVTALSREASGSMAKAPSISFPVPHITTSFSYYDNDVDPSLASISEIKTRNFSMTIRISLTGLERFVDEINLTDLRITLPKGLRGTPSRGTYDPATGVISLGDITCNPAGFEVMMNVTAVEVAEAGIVYKPASHTFEFKEDIAVDAGSVSIDPSKAKDPTGLPEQLELVIRYDLSDLEVVSISGMLSYSVDNFDIPEVMLDELPDFLRQEGTNIVLNNPQIYLSVSNPLYTTSVTASTGLELISYRSGVVGERCPLPRPVTIGTTKGAGPYKYCLSPIKPAMQPGYEGADYLAYPTLGRILAGDGLPDAIKILAVNPCFPEQPVTDLPIGRNFGPIKGSYLFFAPLALEAGSTIVYSDSDTGWSSDDLDDLTIETLTIKADVSTDINMAVELSGNPLDRQGQPMSGVEVSPVTVPANAKDHPIEITVTGPIRDLDGFLYRVRLISANDKTLAPDQHLSLHNIRAYVSGKYVTKL